MKRGATNLEPESINLLKTSKFMTNTVKGAIGEIIGWQYLTKKFYPSWVQSLQGARPCQAETYDPTFPIQHIGPLTDGQKEYVSSLGGRSWDFITETWQKPSSIYLVEVKTSAQYRHLPWHDRRKLPSPERVKKVKGLGFTPILLKVLLRENWQVEISSEML